jgi:hypothetical protein
MVGRRETRATRYRSVTLGAQVVGLVGCYYLLPLFGPSSGALVWLRAAAAALLLGAALALVTREIAREVRADASDVHVHRLLMATVAGVVCFALVDFVIARTDATQFPGLATKTDALYFAMSTLTTVGFGDVHAEGQLARVVVTAQLAFNVVVLASAARALARGVTGRSRTDPAAGVLRPTGTPPEAE